MSCGYSVTFLRNPNEEHHQKMVRAARALKEAGISEMPKGLADYFRTKYSDDLNPDEVLEVARINIESEQKGSPSYITYGSTDCQAWIDIDVRTLPKDVAIIRAKLSC